MYFDVNFSKYCTKPTQIYFYFRKHMNNIIYVCKVYLDSLEMFDYFYKIYETKKV